jgi:ABC-2 type transport system permease protein
MSDARRGGAGSARRATPVGERRGPVRPAEPAGSVVDGGRGGRPVARRPMTLWRLELVRLLRSKRWVALLGVFGFFGLLGPVLARYMAEILGSVGGGVEIIFPDPVPADGITQYLGNTQQIGLLVVLVVAAGALAFDGRAELAAFLRTRATIPQLLVPRFTVSTLAACGAFTVGMLLAWYQTRVLLGSLPVPEMLAGIAYWWVYLAFAVAVVAFAAGLLRGTLGVVALSAGILLVLPVLGIVEVLAPWMPSALVGAPDALLRGEPLGEHLRAAAAAVVATVVLLAGAVALLRRREL